MNGTSSQSATGRCPFKGLFSIRIDLRNREISRLFLARRAIHCRNISKQPEQRLRDGDLSLPLCFLEVCAEKGRNFYLQSSWQHLRSCPKLRNDARQETPQSSCAKDMARRATAGLHEKSLG